MSSAELPMYVLVNPASAGGKALRRWQRIEPALRSARAGAVHVHIGQRPGELAERARALASQDCIVVAAGGDGTSHEVINGLLHPDRSTKALLGWLPLGSGNDLARGVGVGRDSDRAVAVLAVGHARAIDIGLIRFRSSNGAEDHRVFGNSLSAGISADVLRTPGAKPFGGKLDYAIAALAELLKPRPVQLAIRTDGQTVFDGRCLLASFGNGPFLGAGMCIAPGAVLDDGSLDLITVDAISSLRAIGLFPRVYGGRHLTHPAVRRRLISRCELVASDPLALEIDGERIVVTPPVEVSVLPRAIRAIAAWPG